MIMYSLLYDECVIPTMLYSAEVSGYINSKNLKKKKNIKN